MSIERISSVCKVLLYERPYSKVFFRKVVSDTFDNAQLTTMSEYKDTSDIWLSNYLYNASLDSDIDIKISHDIIKRCRTLRIMDLERALRIVRRTWNGIERLFLQQKFDYVISLSIDNYIIDVIYRIAEKYDVPVFSFLGSFASGYIRFTLRGEHNALNRGVSEEEAKTLVKQVCNKTYLPPSETVSVNRNLNDVRRFYYRRALIERAYYPLKKLLTNDPDNARYNMLNLKDTSFSDYVTPHFENYFTNLDDVSIKKEKTVYLPLHYYPEATTDYYTDRTPECGGYIPYIIDVIKGSDPEIQFLVKEHPSMFGRRPLEHYEQLLSLPNVLLIHPQDRSNELLDFVDYVATDNGTVGVEALMRGKRILGLDRSYYADLHPNFIMVRYISSGSLRLPPIAYDPVEFAASILDGCVRSDYIHSSNQSRYNPEPVAKAIAFAISSGIRLG